MPGIQIARNAAFQSLQPIAHSFLPSSPAAAFEFFVFLDEAVAQFAFVVQANRGRAAIAHFVEAEAIALVFVLIFGLAARLAAFHFALDFALDEIFPVLRAGSIFGVVIANLGNDPDAPEEN